MGFKQDTAVVNTYAHTRSIAVRAVLPALGGRRCGLPYAHRAVV
jgi:hypothetical protein